MQMINSLQEHQVCLLIFVQIYVQALFVTASVTPVRLIGGQNKYEGTVEIYHNGWGTICDDNFGQMEATVICRMLGFLGNSTAFPRAHFGQGSGPILLDGTSCTGSEDDMSLCGSQGWGNNDCRHQEDAGVRCSALVTDIRLIGGRGNYEGRIDVYYAGQWGSSICSVGFDDKDASVVCRSLGFTSGKAMPGGYYGKSSGPIMSGDLQCSGTEDSIDSCNGTFPANRSHACNHTAAAGVRCSHTPVRLVGGSLPSEGRVEIQHNGVWGTVCGLGFQTKDADVLCHMLGFNYPAVSVVRDGRFGRGNDPIWLNDSGCQGNESDIYQCDLLTGWDNNTCTHLTDVGIKCEATDIRLVGGLGPWEGRLEINLDGRWGAVCDTGFGDTEADVVCRMLGYTGRDESHKIYRGSFFGTSAQTHFDRLRCVGDEGDISQCAAEYYSTCSRDATVGLSCAGVQVRLVDGPDTGAGRVEIFHNKVWGSICDSKWDDQDATVVCRMLVTYPLDRNVSGKAFTGSHFGYGKGRVWMSDVECNGTEHDIMQCNFDQTGGVNCDHRRDAGVICDFGKPVHIENGKNNTSNRKGQVEVFESGQWYGVCSNGWSTTDAKVVCNSLGFWSANATFVASRTNIRNSSSGYHLGPSCNGNEGSLALCPLEHEWGTRFCSDDLEIECTQTNIGSASIRLVDGPGPWKGRLEVKQNGRWGSFCFANWSVKNSEIICKSLRYNNTNATFFAAQRGSSSYRSLDFVEYSSMMFATLTCGGTETDIGFCTVDYNTSSCGASNNVPVGIDCSGNVSARLSDDRTLSGQVYFYNHKEHTAMTVCKQGVNSSAAKVVCAMAGYQDTDPAIIPSIFSAHPLPVLYTDIDCDGWETHVGQCTTLRDNNTCDSTAYISCFNCTRLFDSASGTLTSSNYPNNYEDNTDCLYSIISDNIMQVNVLKLQIHDLELAGHGDFLEIQDGNRGRQLGMFASSLRSIPYLVTNTGMFSIRFKTNGHGNNARGFNISWSPLEIPDAVTINCEPDGWDINVNSTILRQLYPDSGVSQIKLSDQNCTGYVAGDLVVFRHSFTECSTQTKVTTDSIIYSNQLVYPESKDPFPLIVHGYRWKVDVECLLPRRDITDTNFHPNQTAGHQTPHISSTTHYSTSLKFYSDGTFYKEITGNPVTLKTGENVYVQVNLNSDDVHVKMRLHTCSAKPNINSDARLTYTLIKNGCVVDPDTTIISQGTHVTRFVFNAFEFPVDHSNVYVSCNATFCQTGDASAECSQTCSPHVAIIGRDIHSVGILDNSDFIIL